ncbi:MAG TPA: tRNA lysidine(34) synthetase TilS [Planctomycetes bacterium]|nr:tRNA lysidine(34) synthetase TilS [Planctomycetota bacterium]
MTQSCFESALTATIRRWLPECPRPRLGIAVSGGLDSMLLLESVGRGVAAGRPWQVEVLHVDHGLRTASQRDARAVIAAASRSGFPCRVARLDLGATGRSGSSMEHAAREGRYRALARLGEELHLDAILTGQHRDDQGETLAWKLSRGHGIMGLVPMPEARRLVAGQGLLLLRPFLPFPRSALAAQARRWSLSWREDESNGDLRHRRNLLRHVLIPLAAEGQTEELLGRLAALGSRAAATRDRTLHLAHHLVAKWATSDVNAMEGLAVVRFPLAPLRTLPFEVSHAVIALLMRRVESAPSTASLPPSVTRAVRASEPAAGGPREIRSGLFARWDDGATLVVEARHRSQASTSAKWPAKRLDIPGIVTVPSWPWAIRAGVENATGNSRARTKQTLPQRVTSGPLHLRRWVPGEKLRPFGLGGRKRVVDLLHEARIPSHRRPCYPVVADDEGILWIPGVRADERCRIRGNDEPLISLEMVSKRGAG